MHACMHACMRLTMHSVSEPFQLRQHTVNHLVSCFALTPMVHVIAWAPACSAHTREHTDSDCSWDGPAVDIAPCHGSSASADAYLIVPFKHPHRNLFIQFVRLVSRFLSGFLTQLRQKATVSTQAIVSIKATWQRWSALGIHLLWTGIRGSSD
jgi:hypothetical protein